MNQNNNPTTKTEESSCYKCGKTTDTFCDICNSWVCETHSVEGKEGQDCLCPECSKK